MTAPAHPAADPQDITYGELLPFLSLHDLRRRGFMWPGLATAAFGIGLEILSGSETSYLYLLSTFLGLANLYLIFLWCGKKMPFLYLLGIGIGAAALIDFLLINLIILGNTKLPFPIAPALIEEPVKALPLLLVWVFGRFLPHRWQRRFGLREPLDGIMIAAASASGFAFLETMADYMPTVGAIIGPARFVMGIYGHIAWSAVLGYYAGLAAMHHHRPMRVVGALVLGILLAGGLHDLWDAPMLFPDTIVFGLILAPLDIIVIALASLVVLAAMILKGRQVSPEREFLWPFGSISPYRSPEVQPLPAMMPMPGDRWLAIEENRIRLAAGVDLTARDIPSLRPAGADGVIAQVMADPRQPETPLLRNLSRTIWEAVLVDGSVREVRAAETIHLVPGTRIAFGTIACAVLLTPHDAPSLAAKPPDDIGEDRC